MTSLCPKCQRFPTSVTHTCLPMQPKRSRLDEMIRDAELDHIARTEPCLDCEVGEPHMCPRHRSPQGLDVAAVAAVLRRHIFGSQVLTFDTSAWINCTCGHRIDVNVFDGRAQVGPAHDLFVLHVADAITSDINVWRST